MIGISANLLFFDDWESHKKIWNYMKRSIPIIQKKDWESQKMMDSSEINVSRLMTINSLNALDLSVYIYIYVYNVTHNLK